MTFRSHIDGSIHRFTPEHATAVQEALGSDIAVAFDQPVFPSSPRDGRRRRDGPDPSLGGALAGGAHADRTRRCSGSSRADSIPELREASDPVHRGAAVRWAVHRRPGRRRDARAARRGPGRRRPAPRRRPAAALPDGPRLAGGPAGGRPSRRGPVRQRAAGPGRPERPAVGAGRPAEHPQPAVPRRSGARAGRLPVPALPAVLASLSGPSVPGEGAAGVPSRDLSQPDLHPRLHGQDPSLDPGRYVPR